MCDTQHGNLMSLFDALSRLCKMAVIIFKYELKIVFLCDTLIISDQMTERDVVIS